MSKGKLAAVGAGLLGAYLLGGPGKEQVAERARHDRRPAVYVGVNPDGNVGKQRKLSEPKVSYASDWLTPDPTMRGFDPEVPNKISYGLKDPVDIYKLFLDAIARNSVSIVAGLLSEKIFITHGLQAISDGLNENGFNFVSRRELFKTVDSWDLGFANYKMELDKLSHGERNTLVSAMRFGYANVLIRDFGAAAKHRIVSTTSDSVVADLEFVNGIGVRRKFGFQPCRRTIEITGIADTTFRMFGDGTAKFSKGSDTSWEDFERAVESIRGTTTRED